ncbi:MAG TPA: hypothetical protein VKA31_05985, partial [Mariprofundaceae bacterium]|nr:hypothetical protein [Mariprofundaceae bacterium]
MSGTITINIDLNVTVAKKRGYFLASCEQLDVHAEGDSPEDAMRHVHDALQGFLRTCLEMGTLE